MVQIAVLIVAVAAGVFSKTWRQARLITVAAFLVTSAVQTPMVLASDDIESPIVYWGIQVLTLAVGVGISWAIFARRQRRAGADARFVAS